MTITIRRTEPSDASALRELFVHKSVYENTLHLPHTALTKWQKHLADIPDNVYSYVAVYYDDKSDSDKSEGEIFGNLGLAVNTRERQRHSAAFGITVKESFHGQGIGKLLMSTLIDLADNWLNLRRLELTVLTANEPAIGLYKKFGFVIEGEAVDFAYRDGQYVNAYYMARIKGN